MNRVHDGLHRRVFLFLRIGFFYVALISLVAALILVLLYRHENFVWKEVW